MKVSAACPLYSTAENEIACKQEKCAWFDEFQCVLFTMKNHLHDITNNTSYIYVQDTSAQVIQLLEAVEEIKEQLGNKAVITE